MMFHSRVNLSNPLLFLHKLAYLIPHARSGNSAILTPLYSHLLKHALLRGCNAAGAASKLVSMADSLTLEQLLHSGAIETPCGRLMKLSKPCFGTLHF